MEDKPVRKNLRIGVFGCWRGNAYIKSLYAGKVEGFRITALCDKKQDRLEKAAALCPQGRYAPKLFTDVDEFFDSKLFDAVLLCNYFNEHAKYAIKALEKNIHVFSETMAASTLAEAVALCRAAEKSKAIYMLGENYPYSRGNLELKRLYEGGTLGKLVFAEGEYVHPMGPKDTYKYNNPVSNGFYHWRRFVPVTYYSSHALAPLIYMTGEMPKRVVAMAAADSEDHIKDAHKFRTDAAGVMLITTEGGAVIRVNGSTNIAPHGNWYRLGCVKGGAETIRGDQASVRLCYNSWSTPEGAEASSVYKPEWPSNAENAEACGHGGGDYWVVRYFVEACKGERKPFPDVYEATAMSAVAILGWRSILNGNIPYDIPDFRKEEDKLKYEQDRQNPFPSEEMPNNIPYSTKFVPFSNDFTEADDPSKE